MKSFDVLTEADINVLYEGAVRNRLYQRGQFLFHEGQEQPELFLVRGGRVRIERQVRGQNVVMAHYEADEVLDEIAFLLGEARASGSAVAEDEVVVDVLSGSAIRARLKGPQQIDKLDVGGDGKIELGALIEGLKNLSQVGFAERFYRWLAQCLGTRLGQVLPTQGVRAAPRRRYPHRLDPNAQRFPDEFKDQIKKARSAVLAVKPDAPDAQNTVDAACDELVRVLHEFTQNDALFQIAAADLSHPRDLPELARTMGAYAYFKTYDVFMQSKTIMLGAHDRSRGRKDREFLERVELREPCDGPIAKLVDQWFLKTPLCESRRRAEKRVTELLREELTGLPQASADKLRVTSLAAGTAAEIFGLFAGNPPPPVLATCFDADADAILLNEKRAEKLHLGKVQGQPGPVSFVHTNLFEVIRGHVSLADLPPQHVIYGLGVGDHLDDEDVGLLLNWAHTQLVRGGCLILTNLSRERDNKYRAFVEHILDLPVCHRTRDELSDLFAGSPFGRPTNIDLDENRTCIFARCRKS